MSVVTAGPGTDAREAVASAARLLAAAGLVEGFGHVSVRAPEGFLITATDPLGSAAEARVHAIAATGEAEPEAEGVPIEAPLHAAVYSARPDVAAICRTHSPAMVAFGARGEVPPLFHGLGGLAGEVRLHPATGLIASREAGEDAVGSLGVADCLILRANGGIATGPDIGRACVRAYFLEERCKVALAAGPAAVELSDADTAARSRWFAPEAARAWRWLQWRFGDGPVVPAEEAVKGKDRSHP
ncbi:MAG TPA: class II aldolase/adducin family protein [Solirubrobacterales bacterium]|jgi:ribulose-5-phosphate 4-epimerase/fuculose-1-phosphate aldolase